MSHPSIGAARLVSGGTQRTDVVVTVASGRINEVRARRPDERCDVEVVDGVLVPGLVDLQVNGAFGVDLSAAGPTEWTEVTSRLPETGVTAFVPTFVTAPLDDLGDALRKLAAVRSDPPPGARVLGGHLEGPFLSARYRGAHDAAHLILPAPEAVEQLLRAGGQGTLAMVTLAPELAGALDATRTLTASGVVVAVGHSDATADQVRAAVDAGARVVTHLFNAQRPLHHREPGVVGAALVEDRLSLGLVVDLHHVAPDVVRLAFAAAGDRVLLVSDAVAAAGMPPGRYSLGGAPVDVEPGRPPTRPDGVLAGSGLRLDDAVANCVALGVPLAAAVDAATRRPADLVGRPDLGRIEPGAAADLTWLGDDLRARATWVAGEVVFGAGLA
jgi:N-acetylglucosamine-6-phosphate deacetylase